MHFLMCRAQWEAYRSGDVEPMSIGIFRCAYADPTMQDEPPDSSEEVKEPRLQGAMDIVSAASAAAIPGLAELVVSGSGVPTAAVVGALTNRLGRYGGKQTESLIEGLRERVARLEEEGKLDRERLARLDELGGMQAVSANLFAVPEKTALYADLLAGVVSTEAPEVLDVEAFLETLQSLSVAEVSLAAEMYDRWEGMELMERQQGVTAHAGEDTQYYLKRLEGAGLITSILKTGPPGAGVTAGNFELTPTLERLIAVLRSGRGST